jgi:hypothetical protein
MHLISAERSKQTNCFSVRADGKVEEGIYLSLNHPMTGGKPALILGESTYVARDIVGYRSCLYEVVGGDRGLVRRASLGSFTLPSGKSFPLLRKLDGEPHTRLVHVDFGMPQNARLRPDVGRLYAGIGRREQCVAWSDHEALVEVKKGEEIVIFYPDGRVTAVHYEGLSNFFLQGYRLQMFDVEQALEERIGHIDRMFEVAAAASDEKKKDLRERNFHELASMLSHTGLFPHFRKEIIGAVGHYARRDGGRFEARVHRHFYRVLKTLAVDPLPWWMVGGKDDGPMLAELLVGKERKGKPAAEIARKKVRAEKERQRREALKGLPRNDDSNTRKKGKTKKK